MPTDRLELAFVPEHELGLQQLETVQQALLSVGADPARRSQVDADAPSLCLYGAGCLRGRLLDGRAQKGVTGEEQPLAPGEPADVEILRTQAGSDSSVGEHRPGPVPRDEGDDDAVGAVLHRPVQFDATARQLVGGQLADDVGSALSDEMRFRAEHRGPGGDVRRLPAGADLCLRVPLLLGVAEAVGLDDHVEQ